MLCIVFYICLVYPYLIGFRRKFPGQFNFYAQIIVTISLILNIFMTSVTAVKTKKKYIKDFKKIVGYRMNTLGFYLDVVAIIPFEYIVTIHQSVKYHDNYRDHLFYLCKGTKLCLVWRLSSFFENLERKLLYNSILVKVRALLFRYMFQYLPISYLGYNFKFQIVKYCVYICLLCYWSGVILFMESCFVNRCSENSWFSRALIWEDQKLGTRSTK